MYKADLETTIFLPKNLFPVVGIGVSPGGFEACKKLVRDIPVNSGMAYLFIEHVPEGHDTSLPEMLQKESTLPVHKLTEEIEITSDHIYFIPADKMLTVSDGTLRLSPALSKKKKNNPVDIFFSSLAEVYQGQAIGIVLPGNGTDGAIGLKNIKGHGGITFAQTHDDTIHDGTSQNRINAEIVDFILAPEKMAQQLLKLKKTLTSLSLETHTASDNLPEEESFKRLFNILQVQNGVDFTYYKQTIIRRRILYRMAVLNIEEVARYVEYLDHNKTEQNILFEDLLIPLTSFFRDPKVFENLSDTVFPELLKNKSSVNPLRVWIAGCSTGEEVYSMAMCLDDYLANAVSNPGDSPVRIQIFATDVSEKLIEKTRAGIYHENELEGITASHLHRFFSKTGNGYQVKKEIRDMCVFTRHNFLKDPPFAKIDLISCRNVLIYMEPFLQKKALAIFHDSLYKTGYLLLGKSETLDSSSELFLPLGKKEKTYIKKPISGKYTTITSEHHEETIKFKDYGAHALDTQKNDGAAGQKTEAIQLNKEKDILISKLEKDLAQAFENILKITENKEAVNAELKGINDKLNSVNQQLGDLNTQQNQARLFAEAIVATIHDPLLVLSQDFKIKSANDSFYQLFLLTQVDTIGFNLFELENNGWEIPELRNRLLEIQNEDKKFVEGEINYTFPSAGNRSLYFKAKPFQKDNGENQVLLALEDITERREIENAEKKNADELKKLLENIPQITLTASANGSITYFNKFFLDYSGMKYDEALKKGLETVIKPEMLDEFKKMWSQVIETGEDFKMELQLKNKSDNKYRWHLYRASPIRNDEGAISSWVGAATDLHDRITREHEKDEFISIASHELKTPLTSAKAYVQLLQLGLEETNNKDLIYAQKAGASIDRLNDLIRELLDVSKIQNGKLALNITTFDFNEMMSAAIEDVQCATPTHNITKIGKIPNEIKGDKERLHQVVVNLLSNAIKYSPKANKVVVTMALKKDELTVSVKDRGIGIRKENLWKIFERYYREEERTIHFQGLGIGLYISYEIIQRHNGKLWAETNGGRGSTFYFTVPV